MEAVLELVFTRPMLDTMCHRPVRILARYTMLQGFHSVSKSSTMAPVINFMPSSSAYPNIPKGCLHLNTRLANYGGMQAHTIGAVCAKQNVWWSEDQPHGKVSRHFPDQWNLREKRGWRRSRRTTL